MKSLITLTVILTALGFTEPSFADRDVFGVAIEENETAAKADTESRDSEIYKDIKLLPDREASYNLKGLNLFANDTGTGEYDVSSVYVVVPEYTSKSIRAGDILSKVPSVRSEDEKTIGILVPPFGYFAKKF